MPMDDTKRRAQARYRKKSVTQLVVRFYPSDGDLKERIKAAGGTTWLKELARTELAAMDGDPGLKSCINTHPDR